MSVWGSGESLDGPQLFKQQNEYADSGFDFPRRLAASVYADASGLECLAGALYVSDGDRCRALLAALAAIDGGGDDDEASPT